MTNEEKELLLKDLCARLPYGLKISIYDDYSGTIKDEELNVFHLNGTYNIEYRKLRPYLRPMSSMTEEECEECMPLFDVMDDNYIPHEERSYHAFDWLNAHHFDYRGLIERGLALEASGGMYFNGEGGEKWD